MKKAIVPVAVALAMLGSVAATVWAAEGSPFGKIGEYDKVELLLDRTPVSDRGVLLDGKLYVPVDALRDRNKAAYYYDPVKYQAYLFFGGGETTNPVSTSTTSTNTSKSTSTPDYMVGIPYDADDYHAGMMRQDIINIAAMAKALKDVSKDMDTVVYSKLTFNRDPDLELLKQRMNYRSMPFEIMEDRMYALADELGRQISSSERRKMKDIIDDIHDAIRKKEKAMDALQDWLNNSDEDDLDDFRDYEADAQELLIDIIGSLTGENVDPNDKTPTKMKNNLLDEVDEWSAKIRK